MCADGNLIVIWKWFLFKSTILMEIWSKTDANPKENRKWSKKPWKLKQKTQRGGEFICSICWLSVEFLSLN